MFDLMGFGPRRSCAPRVDVGGRDHASGAGAPAPVDGGDGAALRFEAPVEQAPHRHRLVEQDVRASGLRIQHRNVFLCETFVHWTRTFQFTNVSLSDTFLP